MAPFFYKSQYFWNLGFDLIFRWINTKHGIPSTDVAKNWGVTLKTAWRMGWVIKSELVLPTRINNLLLRV
ncbi:hypothetical protein [Spiroplasma endosymbiont of Lariophagus distinguendus]|uniref:hypothetical protein n=1 Tax=Spiroplasma endosymbiont of Lariophagus distinguendus TaxID=2935082 RepID=UPI00207973A0|nr:hypothetical protein [Spiroplasma endosymbiont of Lariophagus distinguendus]